MKHLDRVLLASGAALILSGGVAAAALGPSNVATAVMASLPGDLTLVVQNNAGHFGGANFLGTAATYIGITEDALRAELQTGKSLADVAVAHGKTRDGLVAALTQAATSEISTLVDSKNAFPAPPAGAQRGPGGRGGPAGPGGSGELRIAGDPLAATATYLGLTEADLRTKVQGGQTLAQIAAATSGKSKDGLIKALVADASTKIDAAQTAGRITADQATAAKADLTTRITQFVDSTRAAGPGFGGPGRGHR